MAVGAALAVAPPPKLKVDVLAAGSAPPPKVGLGCEAPPKVGLGWDAPPKVKVLSAAGLLAVAAAAPKVGAAALLVFDELPPNLKTSFPVEAPPPNENPPDLAGAGADDPVLVGLVSVFPNWKVEEALDG